MAKPWLNQAIPVGPAPVAEDEDEGLVPNPFTPDAVPPAPSSAPAAKPWLNEAKPVTPAPAAPMPSAQPPAAGPKPNFLQRTAEGLRKAYTGEERLDPAYAERPEFGDAYRNDTGGKDQAGLDNIRTTLSLAAIAPTETGKVNILKARIPGLEEKKDAKGNLLLKAPGMTDFAYLNKPGFSAQDVGDFGLQTIATLPFLGPAGAGTSIAARTALGAGGMGAASVAQDALAAGVGSQEGIDPVKAAVSAGLGAALPGVVEPILRGGASVLGAAARYPINRVRSALAPDAQASRDIASAVGADRAFPRGQPLTPQEARAAGRAGQDLRVIDAGGEATRALARSAANQSPEARSLIGNLIDERLEGQSTRAESFIRDLVNRPGQVGGPNAPATREALEIAARNARRPLYDAAYSQGRNGLMSPILTKLSGAPAMESAMAQAANTVRNRAAAAGGRTTGTRGPNGYTLEFWDAVKRNLDDQIGTLKRQGALSAARDIDALRRPLVAELDRMVPDFARARGTAQTYFQAQNALEAGENFVAGRFEGGAARRALAAMTQQERDLFAEGFATRFISRVRDNPDRRSLLNSINNSPNARERLTIALGPNRARQLETFLRVEGVMDLVRGAMGNSTTARQLVELGLVGGLGYSQGDEEGGLLATALLLGNKAINRRVATRIAQQLLSNNPAQVQTALRQVASTPMLDALRNFDRILVRTGVASQGAQGLTPARPAPQAPAARVPAAAPQPALPSPARQPAAAPMPSAQPPAAGPAAPAPATPGRGAGLQGLQEAQRMAEDAIARGAPREAVMARLDDYIRANNLGASA